MDSTSQTSPAQDLTLQLEAFEGPLDLLLNLIRERDLDIFDIPIFEIAKEFQLFVELYHRLDLDKAGEYLAMAAELAQIKSKMLLPRVEDQEEDPRKELVDKLLEHEQVQQAAAFLGDRTMLNRDVFRRGTDPVMGLPRPALKKAPVHSDSLMHVFQDMLKRRLTRLGAYHQVKREHVSVRQRIVWLCQMLREDMVLRFSAMLEEIDDRVTMIATFLALLELGRLRRIRLRQIDTDEGGRDIAIEASGNLDDIPLGDVATFSTLPEHDFDLADVGIVEIDMSGKPDKPDETESKDETKA